MHEYILMVEDDDRTRMALVDMLARVGYHVVPACDGAQALDLLKEHSFDVVITDIRLGDVDGIEVLHAARSDASPPAVILLTGYGSLETAIAALRAGAFDYLLKPCAPTALLQCVSHAIERRNSDLRQAGVLQHITQIITQFQQNTPLKRAEPVLQHYGHTSYQNHSDPVMRIGNLYIDRLRHTVLYQDIPVHLTPTEYDLLVCLAEAGDRVLSYREIARHTHGQDIKEGEAHSLLKSHIRNLRRKINPHYIVSVRGVGYVIVAPIE